MPDTYRPGSPTVIAETTVTEPSHPKSIVALEVLYSMLAAALLTQNHESSGFEDKVAGFFTFSIVAGTIKMMSLVYHRCSQGLTVSRLLKEHMSDRKP